VATGFLLAIDPYPRQPGAVFEPPGAGIPSRTRSPPWRPANAEKRDDRVR
jgi:hypothetical protein